jgi:uncharacterized protein YaaQ
MHLVLAGMLTVDADPMADGLPAAGYRITRLNPAGGFFRRDNVTLLIGVESEQVDDVLRIIRAIVPVYSETRPPKAGMPMHSVTVFVLEAGRFTRP